MHRMAPQTEPTPRWIFNPVCLFYLKHDVILLFDCNGRQVSMCKMTMIIRWSLCLCAGHCRLSRRITAGCWRPWKCERSLRPPWGCTAGAQHAQTKIKCPYRPSTTKNGWDSSHRTEISLSWKFCFSSTRLTFSAALIRWLRFVWLAKALYLFYILFYFCFISWSLLKVKWTYVCLSEEILKCVLLWIFSLP